MGQRFLCGSLYYAFYDLGGRSPTILLTYALTICRLVIRREVERADRVVFDWVRKLIPSDAMSDSRPPENSRRDGFGGLGFRYLSYYMNGSQK